MKHIDTFAQDLAEQVLGRHCGCYGDKFPSPECTERAGFVAKAVAGGYVSHATPGELAETILRSHCACVEFLNHEASADMTALLARDLAETTKTIETAFDARHIEEAHAEAVAADHRGG